VTATLALLLAWLAAAANGQDRQPAQGDAPESEFAFVLDVFGNREKCNAGNARHVTFERVARGDAALHGKCVAVSGYQASRALFASRRYARVRFAASTEILEGRRIGLYGLSRVLPQNAPRIAFYKVVGIVGSCEELGAGGGMVMGYCHYTAGPYLAVSELQRMR
jgi:hypothetical protein